MHGRPAQATAPTPAAAPAGKAEDLYEMAIQYKKEEDFSGWYTDVRLPPIERSVELTVARSSSRDRCSTTTTFRGVTSFDLGRSTSGKTSKVDRDSPSFAHPKADVSRMVRCRDQEAGCAGLLLPDVRFGGQAREGEGPLGGLLARGCMGHQSVSSVYV